MSLLDRTVRYSELKPCTNAFIDTRSPGSDKKENFTIIGPGVAENPNQHIHITIPHGFNIGGARQPPGCLNSQHSHLTEEFFVIHSGTWAFKTGVNADDGEVILNEGDVISIPMDIFRGFENVGEDVAYLYAVLGSDNPGRVLWAPSVFDMAKEYGLVLLENGSLVDTTLGEKITDEMTPMPVTSQEQIDQHRVVDRETLEDVVIRTADFAWSKETVLAQFEGIEEASLVGGDSKDEGISASKLGWKHGFVVRALKFSKDAEVPSHRRSEEEVIFIQQGQLSIVVDGEALILGKGDTFTTPINSTRSFKNSSSNEIIIYVTRRGDEPQRPNFF